MVEVITELVVEKFESVVIEFIIILELLVIEEIGIKEKVKKVSFVDKNVCIEIVSK